MRTVALLWVLASAATLTLASCSTGDQAPPQASPPATHTVTIEGMRFRPEHLRVRGGDAVIWVNKDLVPHTATASGGTFDSTLIDQGKSWQLTLTTAGRIEYICSFHPMMKGTIEVQ